MHAKVVADLQVCSCTAGSVDVRVLPPGSAGVDRRPSARHAWSPRAVELGSGGDFSSIYMNIILTRRRHLPAAAAPGRLGGSKILSAHGCCSTVQINPA